MKPFNTTLVKSLIFIVLIGLFSRTAIAQKLPAVQNTGYLAPNTIKIDGKADDWGNQFQANNKHNSVLYTIANNQTNLYFVIQTTDKSTIKKIGHNGISLIISPAKKQIDNALTITFPAFNKNDYHSSFLIYTVTPDVNDAAGRQHFFDSVMNQANRKIETTFKLIGTSGVKSISDNLISVYNLDGIKAAARIDNHLAYTYELAIPVSYLKEKLNSDKFSYDIRINGVDVRENLEYTTQSRGNSSREYVTYTAGKITYMIGPTSDPWTMTDAFSTDFWGDYNLVTK